MNQLFGNEPATEPLLAGQYIPLLRRVGSYPRQLGTVIDREWRRQSQSDDRGRVRIGLYEHREQVQGHGVCKACGQTVELVADTEQWSYAGRTAGGLERWRHASYGPMAGDCCGMLIVSYFEGTFVYQLNA